MRLWLSQGRGDSTRLRCDFQGEGPEACLLGLWDQEEGGRGGQHLAAPRGVLCWGDPPSGDHSVPGTVPSAEDTGTWERPHPDALAGGRQRLSGQRGGKPRGLLSSMGQDAGQREQAGARGVDRGTGTVTSEQGPECSEEAGLADIWGKNVPERTETTAGWSWCVWGTQGGGWTEGGPSGDNGGGANPGAGGGSLGSPPPLTQGPCPQGGPRCLHGEPRLEGLVNKLEPPAHPPQICQQLNASSSHRPSSHFSWLDLTFN